jgi:hypothetical protein
MSEAGSGIEGLRHQSAFARYVAERLGQADFKLVDVGCAGGLASGWRQFGDHLAAIGFDTNAEEVARLTALETNPKVRYAAGWVGLPESHPLHKAIRGRGPWHHWTGERLAYDRTYDLRKARAAGSEARSIVAYLDDIRGRTWATRPYGDLYDTDYRRDAQGYPPSPQEVAQALEGEPERIILLPAYLEAAGFSDADFLKIDIDGPDWEVLRSVAGMLGQPSLLGVSLEVSFYGSHDANDNSFHNMDRLMREKGFDLFGLSVRTYAAAALPFPYMDKHPSMNSGGRPLQGDALYMRDLGSRTWSDLANAISDEKIAKATALFALFNLPDHAAEMLIAHRKRLARLIDVDQALDLLVEEVQSDLLEDIATNYRDYTQAFEAEDPRFFDRYTANNDRWSRALTALESQGALLQRAEQAEHDLAAARAELDRQRAITVGAAEDADDSIYRRAAYAEARLRAIESSTIWRATAPLRKAMRLLRGG